MEYTIITVIKFRPFVTETNIAGVWAREVAPWSKKKQSANL